MDFTVSTAAVVKTQKCYVKHILERPQAVSSRSLWGKSISIELLRNKAFEDIIDPLTQVSRKL